MRPLLISLALVCLLTNALLFADWARRGEASFATAAAALVLLCGAVIHLTRHLRL